MTYTEAKVYLEEIAKYGSVLGLESIRNLLTYMEHPEKELKVIHIAGTNGKGSSLSFISSVLKSAGYKVGCYTSPAVFCLRECIRINGADISRQSFTEYLERIKNAVFQMLRDGLPHPTRFEVETALAFLYFKEMNCDLVIVETGMGGLTDATNAIGAPMMCVFTPISIDHTSFLGESLGEIAQIKAGILKPGVTAVSAPQRGEAAFALKERSRELKVPLTFVQEDDIQNICYGYERQMFSYKEKQKLAIRLGGNYQIENACLAIEALEQLARYGFSITDQQLRNGLEHAVWKGRFTCIHEKPLFFIDGAHNEAGALALRKSILTVFPKRELVFIIGVFKDKEYEKMAAIMAPLAKEIYTVSIPGNSRSLPSERLCETIKKYNPCVQEVLSLEGAVERSFQAAGKEDIIVAFGSFSYLREVSSLVEKRQEEC